MSTHAHTGRAARQWYLLVGVRWHRFQSRLARAYHLRVTEPLYLWQALGCPSCWPPSLPWWQPFVYSWLAATGYRPRRSWAQWQRAREERQLQRWGV